MSLGILKKLPIFLLLLLCPQIGTSQEEFVGPFRSWKNVKTDYGAVGDGKTDDTSALQKAFDDLRLHKDSCVLYFPAGVYRLTRPVKTERKAHTDCMGISLIGEDPRKTILRWDGEKGGTMIQYDAWYSKISRLTLDGAGKAGVALVYGPSFSTYNETSDMIFKDVNIGMQMGVGSESQGQAENKVVRCLFLRCSQAGLMTVNFNSMDIWIWYCRFEDCGYGLYNAAGNFHAYQCLFLRSKKADIGSANLMVFSFVNNTSIGSHCFIDFRSGHSWGSPCSITGNRILDPTGNQAIRLGNGGPYLVMDNFIRSRPGTSGPVVEMTWGDQTFIGNRYTVLNPVKKAGRFLQIDEKVVDRRAIPSSRPILPSFPTHNRRRVFEVPPGADAKILQAIINSASQLRKQQPVVHLPKGTYKIDRTLVIPKGSDLQLIGDGAAETATVLQWTGVPGGVLMKLEGPNQSVIRDLFINAGRGIGILMENCDQPGGFLYADQLNVFGLGPTEKPRAGVLVNGVEESDVLLACLQGGTCRNWVEVRGRASSQKPKRRGQVLVLCGATGTSDLQYVVKQGGRLIVRSVYHEMSDEKTPQAILLNDRGWLTIDATRFSYKTSPETPLIRLEGFKGRLTLLTSLLLPVNSLDPARIEIRGNGQGSKVLYMNNLFWQNGGELTVDQVWGNKAHPLAQGGIVLCNVNYGSQALARGKAFDILENRGETSSPFIREMLKSLRTSRIWLPKPVPPGVTGIRLYRVISIAGQGGVGLELRSGIGRHRLF